MLCTWLLDQKEFFSILDLSNLETYTQVCLMLCVAVVGTVLGD